jgi:murein DD-endopeptidase MepM/ murein hydrolase activator NlpD
MHARIRLPRRQRLLAGLVALVATGSMAGCAVGAAQPPSPVAGAATAPPIDASANASSGASPGTQASATASPSPSPATSSRYVFPVAGQEISYAHTHHDYPATDVLAPCGTPVRAVTDGVILEVSRVDSFDKNNRENSSGSLRGGRFISMLGDDGVRYYGSHLTTVADGIDARVRVRAGQQLGTVGKTGNANNTCHLHFGISPPCARTADWWVRRGVVWPWSYLDAWRSGTPRSPAVEVSTWQRKNGCPAKATADP